MTPRSKNRPAGLDRSTQNPANSFTGDQPMQLEFDGRSTEPGSYNDAQLIREVLAESLHGSTKSRAQIAEEMTYLSGRRVTERMLNGYTAESQEDYQFPAELSRAFCTATGNTRLLECMASAYGLIVVDVRDAELIDLGRAFLQRQEAEQVKRAC